MILQIVVIQKNQHWEPNHLIKTSQLQVSILLSTVNQYMCIYSLISPPQCHAFNHAVIVGVAAAVGVAIILLYLCTWLECLYVIIPGILVVAIKICTSSTSPHTNNTSGDSEMTA